MTIPAPVTYPGHETIRKSLLLAGVLLAAAAVAGVAQPRLARSAAGTAARQDGAGAATAARTITVTGNGAVTAAPDRASFQFAVTTRATTAKDAMAKNAAAAAAVIAALKAAGVASADLQTTGVSLSTADQIRDGTAIIGYEADNSSARRRRSPTPARSSTRPSRRAPTPSRGRA